MMATMMTWMKEMGDGRSWLLPYGYEDMKGKGYGEITSLCFFLSESFLYHALDGVCSLIACNSFAKSLGI